jgi:voltage-gated potassium channel
MLSSVAEIQSKYGNILELIRNIIMPIFIIEYIIRLYASGSLSKYKGFVGKFKYAITPYALIDLLSILPYILLNTGFNSSFIRSLRLLRIFRLFRVKKYANFAQMMKSIISNIKEELLVLLFYTFILLILLSFAIYEVEHDAQPNVFSNIFQTMWWAVATLTTVGYGDMYPITTFGRIITAVISIIGIAFVAIPGSMFASEFMTKINEKKEKKIDQTEKSCPKCNDYDVKIFSQTELTYDGVKDENEKLHICKKCNFKWLSN